MVSSSSCTVDEELVSMALAEVRNSDSLLSMRHNTVSMYIIVCVLYNSVTIHVVILSE